MAQLLCCRDAATTVPMMLSDPSKAVKEHYVLTLQALMRPDGSTTKRS
jgi:hypothetical protein